MDAAILAGMRWLLSVVFTCSLACTDDSAATDAGASGDSSTLHDGGNAGNAGNDATVADGGSMDVGAASDAASTDGGELPREIGGDRPARVVVPSSYDGSTPTPLLVLLHGYSASGAIQDLYFGMSRATRMRGMLLVIPDGTVDARGNRFWNATDACCDFDGIGPDDVGYLRGLIAEMKSFYNVDAGRVYLVGHSNGGFMSYRMACDASEDITAIVSLAGSTFGDESRCNPTRPVSVLQIHGTLDTTVPYNGRSFGFPSARETVQRFATRAGCSGTETATPVDFDRALPGDETRVERWVDCTDDLAAELWSIEGGGHIPALNRTATSTILDWLLARAL